MKYVFALFAALVLASCVRDEDVPVAVKSVSVAPQELDLALGSRHDLVATVSPANAENTAVSWSSSDPSVVSVDAIGLVRGLRLGSAVITATTAQGGFTASCAVTVAAPTSLTVSLSGFSGKSGDSEAGAIDVFEGSVDVPFDHTFDRVRAEIQGLDWQVIGFVEATVSTDDGEDEGDGAGGAKVVLTLPETLSAADLCKVARDTYRDYEGWWPASGVSDRDAKVAGLGDILAYRGDVCVGRLYVSDGDRTSVYFHYADRPISLTGSNLHRPDESDSYHYSADFVVGWNAYCNISGQHFGGNASGMLCTTALPSTGLTWRFEVR